MFEVVTVSALAAQGPARLLRIATTIKLLFALSARMAAGRLIGRLMPTALSEDATCCIRPMADLYSAILRQATGHAMVIVHR
jgi:hypothetical protein